MIEEIAVMVMVVSMLFTLLYAWKITGSLRLAFIMMLLAGKMWAGLLWAFHIDHPLFNVVMMNKVKDTRLIITVTADQFVFISFLFTLVVTLLWPYIEPYLPGPLHRLNLVSSGESR